MNAEVAAMRRLSVVIPIYQVEQYLPKCLDSVLLPGREDYEILCVDDGSPDRSGAIAEEYAARHPGLIRVIHRENGGLGAARNTGLEAAEGEFLLFLDSDDCLATRALEEMLEELREPCDILIFDYLCVGEDGRQLDYQTGCAREGSFLFDNYRQLLLELPSACNKLWRRSLFTDSGIRFPGRLWFEDLATCPRLYLRAETIRAVHKPWLHYLQRAGSITRAKNPSRNREIIDALQIVLKDYEEQGALDDFAQELEIMAVKHQLLASTVRVNLADPRSPLQRQLLEDLNGSFPDWRKNPYLSTLPAQHRLLLKLMDRRAYGAVHVLMRANDLVRRKRV